MPNLPKSYALLIDWFPYARFHYLVLEAESKSPVADDLKLRGCYE